MKKFFQPPKEQMRKMLRRFFRWVLDERPTDPYALAEYLRNKGVAIGDNTAIYPNVVLGRTGAGIDPIEIGEDCTLTGCTLIGHDASTNSQLQLNLSIREKIVIGNRCFVGFNATILMGVTLGNDCIVGAGAVVTKSFPSDSIVCGNPARLIGHTSDLIEKRRNSSGRLIDGEKQIV